MKLKEKHEHLGAALNSREEMLMMDIRHLKSMIKIHEKFSADMGDFAKGFETTIKKIQK